jgi:PST family polysaccharide transporter
MITFVSQFATIAVQMISIIVMARLLSPADYGILAMVGVVTAFAQMFRDLGLSSAIVQHKGLTNVQQSNVFWINVLVGFTLTVALCLCSPLVAWFYAHEELKNVAMVTSLNFLAASLGSQSQALLIRNMRFARIAIATIAGSIANLTLTVSLGLAGFSYWSIVYGNLLGVIITSALLLALSEFQPQLPCFKTSIRTFLSFGAQVTVFDLMNYFQRNLDNVLIGYYCSANALGLYNRAYSLLMFPIQSIRSPINSVAYPAMSKLQDSPKQLRVYFLKTVEIIAILTMPLTGILAVVAKPFILLVLGPNWESAAPIFSILAVVAFIQPASGFTGSLLLSLGKSKTYLWCGFFNTIITCIGFMIGVNWGPYGVAISYAISNYIVLVPWLSWAFKETPVTIGEFFRVCLFPAYVTAACVSGALTMLLFLSNNDFRIQLILAVALAATFGALAIVSTKKGREYVALITGSLAKLVRRKNTASCSI